MKKLLLVLLSLAISGASLYTYASLSARNVDFLFWIPLLATLIYLVGLAIPHGKSKRETARHALPIYFVEAFLIALFSIAIGKVFGSPSLAVWIAAGSVVAAPRASELQHFFSATLQSDEEEEE